MSKNMLVLKTSDGESFEVEEAVALQSQTIAHMIEDDCADNGIPLANVTSKILPKVIEYCKKHADGESSTEEELKTWDKKFVDIDNSTIFDLILAANYLNIPGLLDLTCQTIADQIAACKDADEIRAKYGIENDFTPEEEETVRNENQWAFE
ncbi:unnamed protein product [Microthlaspi erraticum]|uniref:SKP1-like protein n=1 Tax=Microthlaspi erraticum TaxID=1685480 RepID=A0A6D2I8V1_9BRAS|nr:unnamed protein product [Microthlaspi erraticum]